MRKLCCLCLVFLLISSLTLAVSAQSSASGSELSAVVSEDGSCHVTFKMTLALESAGELGFPLPAQAKNITLNGAAVTGTPYTVMHRVSDTEQTELRLQKISLDQITGGNSGTYTFTLAYTLPAVVDSTKAGLVLSLPLLSGFSLPLSDFLFTVTLPGTTTQEPGFESGYYPETIMEHLQITQEGNTIRGRYISAIHDQETLTLKLAVDENMFPRTAITARMMGMMDLVAVILATLAILYFFIFMRPNLRRVHSRSTPPEGMSAGEVGRWLSGGSMDLTLMVLSWAQMGYLRIEYQGPDRVLLHRRMDMGNERSVFENQVFKALFGRRPYLDATGTHYARLNRDIAKKTRHPREVFHPRSGNPYIFRGLCLLAAFFAGVMLGDTLAEDVVAVQILVGLCTAGLALTIQYGAGKVLLRHRVPVLISLLCCGMWLVVSILCGDWLMGVGMVIFQFLAGMALAYGGRRSELGGHNMRQLLGLRKHLRTVPRQDLARVMKLNPNYFHNVIPYALALRSERAFARRFDNIRIPECAYLTDHRERQFSAPEWVELLRKTVDAMDMGQQQSSGQRVTQRRPKRRNTNDRP